MTSTVQPSSSWISRTSAASGLSPGSTLPPGNSQRPAASGGVVRRAARTRPSRTIAAPTTPSSAPRHGTDATVGVVHLRRSRDLTPEIDALVALRSGGRVGLAAVLGDLDRRLRRTWAPGLAVRRAWTWEPADRRDQHWWPQGISPSPGPERVLAVSWYAEGRRGRGCSFLDLDRAALPARDAGPCRRRRRPRAAEDPRRRASPGTARGCTWPRPGAASGAATSTTSSADPTATCCRCGSARRRRTRHDDDATVLVPRRSTGEELVAGEYGGAHSSPVAWPGSLSIPRPCCRSPTATTRSSRSSPTTASCAPRGSRRSAAGSTSPRPTGRGGSARSGPASRTASASTAGPLPMGPEDLAYDEHGDWLWTVTEHPRRRWSVAMRRSSFD